MNDHLLIPRHLAQAVTDYLATRPAGEVFQLLLGLRALQPLGDGLSDTDGDD